MKILLLLVGLMFVSGCMTRNMAKLVKELAKDPASVHLRITSIYGVAELTRTNPGTNSPPHKLLPDGTVEVSK